jgi:hypothetical protein
MVANNDDRLMMLLTIELLFEIHLSVQLLSFLDVMDLLDILDKDEMMYFGMEGCIEQNSIQ